MRLKPVFVLALICSIFSISTFSQADANRIQELHQQMSALFQKGDLDGAIPLAEQIVKMQRQANPVRPQSLVTSLENLGQVKLARFKRENAEVNGRNSDVADTNTFDKMQKDAKDAEAIFREVIGLAQGITKGSHPTDQLIGSKNSLAWLLYAYLPPDQTLDVGFDKSSHDRFDSVNREKFYKRIDEAETLYFDAVKDAEASLDPNSDVALASRFNLAEFELSRGNFEVAIPQYEKCISVVEKKYGKRSLNLLPPLRSYLSALIATDQDDQAFEVLSQIVRVTGRSAQMPNALLNISLRSEKAFVTSNSPAVEQRARANKNTAELAGKANVVLSGGGLPGVQGASTFGKTYYENSFSIKLIKVPVRVLVDENGKVVEAEGLSNDQENNAEAEKVVRGWAFHPFKLGPQAFKLKGYVNCLFLADRFTK